MSCPYDEVALEIRLAALESAALALVRFLRSDPEGFQVSGEISFTLQVQSPTVGDTSMDIATTLNERPVFGMSL